MQIWPIAVRELRAEARRGSNYWLRLLGAGAMVLMIGPVLMDPSLPPAQTGSRLFYTLNAVAFVAIWLLVPLTMADCVSREKREGTLGLLFLTSLRPTTIVGGKCLIHGWRAFTLLLAMIPIWFFPVLLGGVAWQDIVLALMLNGGAVALAMAAGLLATAFFKDGTRVMLMAEVFSLLLGLWFIRAHYREFFGVHVRQGNIKATQMGLPANWTQQQLLNWYLHNGAPLQKLIEQFQLSTGLAPNDQYSWWRWRGGVSLTINWSENWSKTNAAFYQAWLLHVGKLFIESWLAFWVIFGLAAWRVKQAWRDQPASAQQIKVENYFCSPRYMKSLFRGKMARAMNQNPIGWLQQHSWQARATRWGWCLALIIAECLIVTDPEIMQVLRRQQWLAVLLLLSLAFVSAGSFRQEREMGSMELLLVTPLREFQIIFGRLRGIWSQFFPALMVLLVAWLYLAKDSRVFSYDPGGNPYVPILVSAVFFLTLPVIGLYLSFRRMHFIGCWILVMLWGVILPAVLCFPVMIYYFRARMLVGGNQVFWNAPVEVLLMLYLTFQFASAALAGGLLYRDLKKRRF